MRKDLRRWTLFHDSAVLHYGNVVADLRRDAQVVGDEQQRDTEPRLDFVEQLQHLRLYRHVQRRDRLIRHQHVGVERQRAGDGDTLALSAGELMRITRDRIQRQIDQFQQLACFRKRFGARHAVIDRPLRDGLADGDPRIERAIRILEYDLDALAVWL